MRYYYLERKEKQQFNLLYQLVFFLFLTIVSLHYSYKLGNDLLFVLSMFFAAISVIITWSILRTAKQIEEWISKND